MKLFVCADEDFYLYKRNLSFVPVNTSIREVFHLRRVCLKQVAETNRLVFSKKSRSFEEIRKTFNMNHRFRIPQIRAESGRLVTGFESMRLLSSRKFKITVMSRVQEQRQIKQER